MAGVDKRRRGWSGFKVAALALLGLALVTYLTQLTAGAWLQPTGDPLFDRYARALRDRQAWRLWYGIEGAALPDSVLARWEAEFGDDPRYWDLRFFCASARANPPLHWAFAQQRPAFPSQTTDEPRRVLELAEERGRLSVAARYRLQQMRGREIVSGLREQVDALQERRDAKQLAQAEFKRLVGIANMESEAAEQAELDALVAAHPGSAWAHYSRAWHHFHLGDDDAGLADLAAGNVAPDLTAPEPFPLSSVQARLEQGVYSGSPIVTGAIVESGSEGLWVPNLIRIKEVGKQLLVSAALSGDIELLDAWWRHNCRLGQLSAQQAPYQATGANLCQLQAGYVLSELSEGLTLEQRRVVLVADEQSGVIYDESMRVAAVLRERYRTLLSAQTMAYDVGGLTQPAGAFGEWEARETDRMSRQEQAESVALLTRPLARYRRTAQWELDYATFTAAQRAQFVQLGKLDWRTLAWPAAWAADSSPI